MPGLVQRISKPFTRVRNVLGDHRLPGVPDWLADRLRLTTARRDPFARHLHGPRRFDGMEIDICRTDRRGRAYVERTVRSGPNHLHVLVTRKDGSYEDLGLSRNLLTNIGRDWWAQQWGFIGAGVTTASPATATSATSLTVTGTPLTASNLATPQLGVAGLRVYASVTGITTAPVYANIVSNTTSVLTLDKWWKVDDTTGTTPASTNAFIIAPGGVAAARFFAFSTDAGAASASDTVLASEVTTNGLGRALGTYAHTYGASTLTLSKTFTATGTITAAHKMGTFSALSSAGADPMLYEAVMNADFTVVNGDQVTPTWTFTLSG